MTRHPATWPWLLAVAGCGQATYQKPPVAEVKGTVTVDGRPLPQGEIAFSIAGQPPLTLPVTNGAYTGDGYVGQTRVEVSAWQDGPPLATNPQGPPMKLNTIAPRYNYQSQLSAVVASGIPNEFSFVVGRR